MAELLSVRLAPEWVTDCLWVFRTGDVIRENYAPELLVADYGVPADLVAAVEEWDAEFQAVFNADDPMSGGFPDERTALAWRVRGERLAERLAAVLRVPVEFHVTGYDRVVTP
jgi:hypothetical protein